MPSESLPEPIRRLIDARSRARAERDWARADALRDEIAALGWQVEDVAGGEATARAILAGDDPGTTDRLKEPASTQISVVLVADDHEHDLARCLSGLTRHPTSVATEIRVVANAPSFEVARVVAEIAPDALVIAAPDRLGWADAVTLGMSQAGGAVVVLLDTSVEPTGDIVTPLLAAFDDPSVGLAGGWGVTSIDAREFEDAPPGEVDAIEGYCLAVRRDALQAVGGFDRRYRFYRNADLDFSFAVRDAGWRAVRTEALPAVRHEHRGWTAYSEEERDRLSRRNFYRFLDRWRDRPDLLLANRSR
jgi:cysteinyl-tRNA synthetase